MRIAFLPFFTMMKSRKIVLLGQLLFISLIFILALWLVDNLNLSLPAGIIGIFLLYLSLMLGVIKVAWVKVGSRWLLAEMLLFFIPAIIAVVNYFDVLQQNGLKILSVIILSTLLTLFLTAWVVDKIYRVELRWLQVKRQRRHRV